MCCHAKLFASQCLLRLLRCFAHWQDLLRFNCFFIDKLGYRCPTQSNRLSTAAVLAAPLLLWLQDLLRFNRFFIDKEEDSVIKLQALSDRIKAASSAEQLQALKAELVDFHGEQLCVECGLFFHACKSQLHQPVLIVCTAH
jgi:hypothetical protein